MRADDDVDEAGFADGQTLLHTVSDLLSGRGIVTVTAQRGHHLVVAGLREQACRGDTGGRREE